MKPIRFKIPFTKNPDEIHVLPSNEFDILADDDRPLFTIHVLDDGAITIEAGMVAKHDGVILSEQITIQPNDSRRISIRRIEYS